MEGPTDFSFPRTHRLSGKIAYTAVYDHKLRKNAGPLTIAARPNELPHCRLGLSVSRRVGNAVKRNRIKRLLREAYRLNRHRWPVGLDAVIIVRPHKTLTLEDYVRLVGQGIVSAAREVDRRAKREGGQQ